jgi:hypothetical protein
MKKLLITIAILLFAVPAWGAEITGATLTGVTISPSSLASWSWPLEDSLAPTAGSTVGTETHAGTARTRVNPDTGLIEAVGANVARFEEVGGHRALLIEPEGTNYFLNSDAPVTQTTGSLGTGTYTAWIDGTGSATIAANTATITGAGAATDGTPVTFVVTVAGTVDVTIAGGPPDRCQVENGPVQTSYIVTPGAEVLDDPGLTDAAEWNDSDATVTQNAGAGTVTWSGAGAGNIFSTDSPFTVSEVYQIKIVVDSITAGSVFLNNSGGAFQGTNTELSSAGTYTLRVTCTNDLALYLRGSATCDAVVSEISATITTRATESGEPHFTLPTGLFDSQGTAIVWWRPGYASVPVSSGIVACSDVAQSLFFSNAANIYSRSGSPDAVQNFIWTANTWYKLIVKWGYLVGGVEKFRVGVDSGSGVSWGTEQTFDGSYTLGSYLRLGYGLFSRMHLRNLMLFPTVLTDAEIDQRGGTP